MNHEVVTEAPTKGKQMSFTTSPKVDAYEPWQERTWTEFKAALLQQASFWGPAACDNHPRSQFYRYPSIGCFGDQKFAVFVAEGKPGSALRANMQIVKLDWPTIWNVT